MNFVPQTGQNIPRYLIHQLWKTGWDGGNISQRMDPPRRVESLTQEVATQFKHIRSNIHYFGSKEGNVLFNDALNTFCLRLYVVRHMVKDHSDSEKGNPLPPHRLNFFPINSKGSFICTIQQTGEHIPRPLLPPVVEHWLEREILFLVYIIIFNIYIYTNERMFNDTPAQKYIGRLVLDNGRWKIENVYILKIHTYMYVHACKCVCVCVRARSRVCITSLLCVECVINKTFPFLHPYVQPVETSVYKRWDHYDKVGNNIVKLGVYDIRMSFLPVSIYASRSGWQLSRDL